MLLVVIMLPLPHDIPGKGLTPLRDHPGALGVYLLRACRRCMNLADPRPEAECSITKLLKGPRTELEELEAVIE